MRAQPIAFALLLAAIETTAATAFSPIAYADPPAEAMELYRRGRSLYNEGRYREAIEEFERAHALDPAAPVLVYNVAVVYERLADLDRALLNYRLFLRYAVSAEERARVETAIRRVEGARSARAASEPAALTPLAPVLSYRPGLSESSRALSPPPAPPSEVAPDRRNRPGSLFWASAGLGAASLVGGAIAGAMALSADAEVQGFVVGSDGTLDDRQALVDRTRMLATVGDAGLVTGIVFAAVAAILYLAER